MSPTGKRQRTNLAGCGESLSVSQPTTISSRAGRKSNCSVASCVRSFRVRSRDLVIPYGVFCSSWFPARVLGGFQARGCWFSFWPVTYDF